MYDIDEQLTHRLHELSAAGADSTPPTQQLLARGRRARHRRTVLTSTSLAVLAVGAVTGIAVANRPGPAVTADPPAVSAPGASPELELVAAITNSQHLSFRLKTIAGTLETGGKQEGAATTLSAFDPATATGYLRGTGRPPFEIRLIGGVKYVKNGDSPWWQYKGRYPTLGTDEDVLRGQFSATADAGQLLEALRAGEVQVTRTGPATYRFQVTRSVGGGTVKFAGDITLDGDKRIGRVAYDWTLTERGSVRNTRAVLEYSGYGEPVVVERPAHAELVP